MFNHKTYTWLTSWIKLRFQEDHWVSQIEKKIKKKETTNLKLCYWAKRVSSPRLPELSYHYQVHSLDLSFSLYPRSRHVSCWSNGFYSFFSGSHVVWREILLSRQDIFNFMFYAGVVKSLLIGSFNGQKFKKINTKAQKIISVPLHSKYNW